MNFDHYDPATVSKVYALEPNPGMIRMAEVASRSVITKGEGSALLYIRVARLSR